MNMKILFWTELFFPHIGGIEVFGAQFIKALLRAGYTAEVVTSHSGARLPDITENEGIRIHRFPFQKEQTLRTGPNPCKHQPAQPFFLLSYTLFLSGFFCAHAAPASLKFFRQPLAAS
jgi:glycosyltransferase involved in cell wall biosynthesis